MREPFFTGSCSRTVGGGTFSSGRLGLKHFSKDCRKGWRGFFSMRVGGGDILFIEAGSEPFRHGRVGGEDVLLNKGSGCQWCLKYECRLYLLYSK